ncbi:hypothetical protein XNC1_2352 [Xenorhabdus nematophila ATCC 19061]|uniref:Uncharacterized protein n=1 Tax=Xenorhabdus nematophila (strain ATCC 19061 / DSM 3370 / CCUG 14189 / LMG 1036 / NCIMB 9965 / AN6) TaxID=406817 RepID=D3VGH5_XENNA|nr:hypothetical protein XNC1_2352 [Xenorhabdus nematophila ATCC 19061]
MDKMAIKIQQAMRTLFVLHLPGKSASAKLLLAVYLIVVRNRPTSLLLIT